MYARTFVPNNYPYIMGMEHPNILESIVHTTGRTIAELCANNEKRIEAARVQWGRTIKKVDGRTFDRTYIPTIEEAVRLKLATLPESKRQDKQEKAKRVTQNPVAVNEPSPGQHEKPEPKPEPQEINWPSLATVRRFFLDTILIGLVIGHAGLIWYDCAELWDVPGQIGGGLAFFIVVAALMLATDATKNVTSQIALVLVFLIDVAAWFVHRPVFETYRADGTVTDVLCGFLCGMSFGALLIYRHQKNN